MDQLFLDNLYEAIEDNLANEQFGVEELAHEIGISRSQLHRKLDQLTGQSSSELIRKMRLEKAMGMLKNKVGTASEISYLVGFGSPSYFNTCFHNQFGISPGKVKQNGYSETPKRSLKLRKYLLFSLSVLVIMVLAMFLLKEFSITKASPPVIVAKVDRNISIAMLPFKNLSPDDENQYFVAGVMSDIFNLLTRIRDIELLIDPQAVEEYKETELSYAEIAQELGVRYLITGGVQKSGNDIRVSVQLVDTRINEIIWSEIYVRELLNIFKIQSEIAGMVVDNLELQLNDIEKQDIEVIPTQNQAAYEAYLNGKEYRNSFNTKRNIVDNYLAEQFFKKSIRLDSNFIDPYLRLTYTYWDKVVRSYEGENWLDSMKLYAEKALKFDPRSVAAHRMNHLFYYKRSQLPDSSHLLLKAKEELAIVRELIPYYSKTFSDIGHIYAAEEKYDSATYFLKKAQPSLPGNLHNLEWTGHYYHLLDQRNQATQYVLEILKRQPDYAPALEDLTRLYRQHEKYQESLKNALFLREINYSYGSFNLARTYVYMGELEKAEDVYENDIKLYEGNGVRIQLSRLYYGYILWNKGDKKQGKEMFDMVTDYYDNEPLDNILPILLSRIHSVMGNKDKAVQYLSEASNSRDFQYRRIFTDPMFENIREDERVQKLINNHKQRTLKMRDNLAVMEAADDLEDLRKR